MVYSVIIDRWSITTVRANLKRHLFEDSVVNFRFNSEIVDSPGVREEDSGRKWD